MSVFNPRFVENFDRLMRPLDCPASTVGTSTVPYATESTCQRKSFYANGRYWVFYSDGTDIVYRTSSDGTTWSNATIIKTGSSGSYFSVFFDGTYLHYAYGAWIVNSPLCYRKGTPNSDGTISWLATEQTVKAASPDYRWAFPTIAVSSTGKPFIGYVQRKEADLTTTPWIINSSTTDGTWTTETDFQLSTTASGYWRAIVVPLTAGKMYVLYARLNALGKGRLYTGSWGDEETTTVSNAEEPSYHSALSEGDDVHFAFLTYGTAESPPWIGFDIKYRKRTYGEGWGPEVMIRETTSPTCGPALSIDSVGNLYCFYPNYPTTNHIFYRKCVDGTWEDEVDWISEETDSITSDKVCTSFYKDYDSKIGLVYVTKTSSPYNVRFDFLTMPPAYPYRKIRHTLQF